jgi:glutamate synthase (NADPH/NADH) small chain
VEVLCVGDCVYNHMGVPPIQIGKLQRFATDQAFEAGWRFFEAGPETGKRVALIGAGPASLAAAHELRRSGHACVVFEKRDVFGGLNTTGVAPYKMRADKSVEEVQWILAIGGIDVRTGMEVGARPTLAELESEYDAVFVGVGLGPDTRLGIPGEELAGVEGAVDFIERMKLGKVSLEGVRRAVVVGGGNTALDCVRELIGLGVPIVTLLYRGGEAGMSGYEHEWSAAREEGARATFHAQPVAFEGTGHVQAVRAVRMDEKKRPIAGSELTEPADLVLIAIGQSKLGQMLSGLDGIRLEHGRMLVDEDGFTGRRGWFAGGDCANGGKEVVNAAAEGKRAARAIHRFLMGESDA